MSSLFSTDSKFMCAMNRLADLMILNVLFLLTSLPIFTIGASVTALYTVCFRFGTDREHGVVLSYFRAFRDDFKQSTVLWILLLLCIGIAFYNTLFYYVMPGSMRYLFIFFGLLLAIALFTASYAFPLLSQFENSTRQTLKNALVLSLGYAPRSIVITGLNILPFVLALTQLYIFFYVGFIWFILYFSAAAYLNTILLRKVFQPFLDKETSETEETSL